MATKYVFVTGGVVSGLGKGITAASLGRLLKTRGLKVASQKLDPYINVDPGTMSPLQHGEVFVTDDGTETDLDLGHYERFIDENLNKYSNLTTGKVYWNVLNKERQGAYLGQTVQIIPHITNEIKSYIYNLAKSTEADVVITEIGGTTGDIESQPFLEAIRQVGIEQGMENCCYIHVVLVPYISGSDEYKSKPAQHSCKELQGMGIAPNIIVLRADGPVGNDIKRKISMFCNVRPDCVIENLTMPSLYECPLMLEAAGLTNVVARQLHLETPPSDLTEWKSLISRIATRSRNCKIALVVRREEEGIVRYVHLGTGNYNDSTAKQYTDCGMFTCSEMYGQDATAVFNMLSGYSEPASWNKLAVAPIWLRKRFIALIQREIHHVQEGREGLIVAKMNSLNFIILLKRGKENLYLFLPLKTRLLQSTIQDLHRA